MTASNGFEGRMIVPNSGGGTSDTEFDMMTSLNSRFFRDEAYAFAKIKRDVLAFPNELKDKDMKQLSFIQMTKTITLELYILRMLVLISFLILISLMM